MKKGMWIFTVLAAASVLAAFSIPAKAADDTNKESSLRVAQELFEMKMYERAYKQLQEVKETDPSNLKARELLAKVEVEMAKRVIGKAKPIKKEDLEKVVHEVNFTDARVEEIMSYLSAKCDVNIVVHEQAKKLLAPPIMADIAQVPDDFKAPAADEAAVEAPFADAARAEQPVDNGGITIRLKDVPLKAVLKYVLQAKGLTYIVDDYAIVIVPRGFLPDEPLELGIFHLYSGALDNSPEAGTPY
jgi:hypothetical protein